MKKRIASLFFALVIIIGATAQMPVYAADRILNVTKKTQEKSEWCWAACAQMISIYKRGSSPSQTDIVKKIKGSNVNASGTVSEIRSAIQTALNWNSNSYSVSSQNVIGYSSITSYINNNKPIVLGILWRGGGGHVYVVSGYDNYPYSEVYLTDPASGGYGGNYTYTALKNGTYMQWSYGTYANTWTY